MDKYPGQFSRAILWTWYKAARKVLWASENSESAHNAWLRIGQILETMPGLCSRILWNERFDEWIAKQKIQFHIWDVSLEFPSTNWAGLIKRHDMNPHGVFDTLPFGAKTIGGITPQFRRGNDGKRVHVDEKWQSIVNFMGLNNSGVDLWAAQLQYEKDVLNFGSVQSWYKPLIANIANDPNTKAEEKPAEAREMAKNISPLVSVLEYNGSCPNVGTGSGKEAFSGESLTCLVLTLEAIHEWVKDSGREPIPILLKLPPHLDQAAMERIIVATHHLVTGYTCINTSPSPELKEQTPIGENKWWLSGKLLLPEMLRTVKLVREIAPETTIIALGWLGTGKNRQERFQTGYDAVKSGADLVSVYSGLVFNPYSIYDILAGAVKALKEKQVA